MLLKELTYCLSIPSCRTVPVNKIFEIRDNNIEILSTPNVDSTPIKLALYDHVRFCPSPYIFYVFP